MLLGPRGSSCGRIRWVAGDGEWGQEQKENLKEIELGLGFSTTWVRSYFFSEPHFLQL